MRQEILLLTAKQTDLIQQKWENCDRLELNLEEQTPFWESTVEVEKPAFPEIEESIRVDGVYLKNFNRIPLLDKEVISYRKYSLISLDEHWSFYR